MQGQMFLCWCAMGHVTAKGSRADAAGLGFCADKCLGGGEAFIPPSVVYLQQQQLGTSAAFEAGLDVICSLGYFGIISSSRCM